MKTRTLHVTSPMMAGEDVLAVQRRLSELGYHPGGLDGQYGPSTWHAVRLFQAHHHLEADGVVGPLTFAALNAKTPAPKPPPAPTAGDVGVLALAESLNHLGVTEKPAGSNHNPFGPAIGLPNGVPWCAEFVSFCTYTAASYVLGGGFHGAGCYPKGCTYVPTVEAWLRATGMWVGRSQPQPGFIAIYNWDGGDPDHIGIVERYLGGGQFLAIEGNTSVGNNSNGGEVMRRQRYLTQVDGFGHLRK